MVAIRSSTIAYVNNASSKVVTFPAGATAGDDCYLFAAHGFGISTPSGWTVISNADSGLTNTSGVIFKKNLTAGDITTGSVTVSFGGTYYGIVALVCMNGAVGDTYFAEVQHTSGATSRTLTSKTGQSGAIRLWFGFGRGNVTITCNEGSQIQTSSNANASGTVYAETLTSTGSVTGTFTFSSAPTSDYCAVVVVQDTPAGFSSEKMVAHAWVDAPDGFSVSKAKALAWIDPHDLGIAKMEALAWLDSTASTGRRRQLINC